MTYCVIPGCSKPQNPHNVRVCQSCGSKLLLRERYRPIQAIACGGFGRTFLAVDEDMPSQPQCVVKQLYFNSGGTSKFLKAKALFNQEAVRLDDLGDHAQIPTLLAHFEQNRWLYLVQEFIEGPTLAQEFKQKGAFNEAQIRAVLNDLLPVLDFIHSRQIVHRDIKPANIIRRTSPSREGANQGQLVLIDFGIAKLFSVTEVMQTGTIIGTLDYMAPEQQRGKVVPGSDLYSLAATCLHLLTGLSPSELFDNYNDRWIWRDFLTADKLVSAELGRILDKMLQDAVSGRYQSAAAVLRDLNPVTKPDPIPKVAIAASPRVRSAPAPSRRRVARSVVPPKLAPTFKNFLGNLFPGVAGQFRKETENDVLTSAIGIDYTRLRDFLATKKWKKADEETRAVLCQAVGKPPKGYLFEHDIAKLPCEDLATIDRLWVKYSEARFGFSVQARIYEGTGKDYGAFCDRIGWLTYNPAVAYAGMQFSLKAPIGHLPSRIWSGGSKWWRHAEAIASKVAECNIEI